MLEFGKQDSLHDWRTIEGFYDPLVKDEKRFSLSMFKFFELMKSMVLFL